MEAKTETMLDNSRFRAEAVTRRYCSGGGVHGSGGYSFQGAATPSTGSWSGNLLCCRCWRSQPLYPALEIKTETFSFFTHRRELAMYLPFFKIAEYGIYRAGMSAATCIWPAVQRRDKH